MSLKEFSDEVAPTKILPDAEMLIIFQFMAGLAGIAKYISW
jgi:hypothetical protein